MELEGVVDEIIFRNDENGYTVFLFDAENIKPVVVGTFLSINVGENLKLSGEFKINNKITSDDFEIMTGLPYNYDL